MLTIKTGEFSIGKLMVKNCMDAIFNQPPFQSGVGLLCLRKQFHLQIFFGKGLHVGKTFIRGA